MASSTSDRTIYKLFSFRFSVNRSERAHHRRRDISHCIKVVRQKVSVNKRDSKVGRFLSLFFFEKKSHLVVDVF